MDTLSSRLHLFNCLGQLTGAGGGALTSSSAPIATNAALQSAASLECLSFKQLLDTQSLVDCTLACDGGKISAHKMVLSACSSYLARIIAEHPVEHPIIILPELGIEDVRTLVHYMYTGELLKSGGQQTNSLSLLRTAAILSINSLSDLLASAQTLASSTAIQQQQTSSSFFRTHALAPTSNGSPPSSSSLASSVSAASLVDHLTPLFSVMAQQQRQQQQQFQLPTALSSATNELYTGKNLYDNGATNFAWNASALNLGLAGFDLATPTQPATSNSGPSLHSATPSGPSSLSSSRLSSASSAASLSSSLSGSPSQHQTLQAGAGSTASGHQQEPLDVVKTLVKSPSLDQLPSGQISGKEFQFKCPVCQNNFQTICSFEYHMQRTHNVTSFGCEICHKPFASLRYVLTDHMRRCHGWKGPNPGANNSKQTQQKQQEPSAQAPPDGAPSS